MSQAVLATTFQDAVFEARAYARMGSLDEKVLVDIAFDYGVSLEKLREAVVDD